MNPTLKKIFCFGAVSFFWGMAAGSGETPLFHFEDAEQIKKIEKKDASFGVVKRAEGLRLEARFGTNSPSPSVYFKNPAGWDLSGKKSLKIPVWNPENESLTVWCRIDSQPREGGKLLSKTFRLLVEGERFDSFRIDLLPMSSAASVSAEDFFGMRGGPINGSPMHIENVVEIIVFLNKLPRSCRVELGSPLLEEGSGSAKIFEKPFPFVDPFGQSKYQDWPGKVKDAADLKSRSAKEESDLSGHPRPANWDEWGGWQGGPALQATGFFRMEKVGGKWWLVDPAGKLFFSHGISFVNFGSWTTVDSREKWFEALPDAGLASNVYRTVKSTHGGYHFQGKEVKAVNFFLANLAAKYPGDFREHFIARTIRRLESWGINTMATWSDPDMVNRKKYPYTVIVATEAPKIEGSSGHWGKFIDVFHPDFKDRFRQTLRAHPAVGDPWCIGFFVDNEMSWGNETSLALAVLASGPNQPAKKVFAEELRSRYGNIEDLNAAWGTSLSTWDELLAQPVKPDEKKAAADLGRFTSRIADAYFGGVRDVFREVAPHNLYLGCRFAWANPPAIAAA
ncbi:MAG: hypothetical protein JNM63_07110, partial [Spirochaetia bacterium]|nr:hypothetical protein [Spirochaetia bacterium]